MEVKIEILDEALAKARKVLSSSQIATAMRMAINEGLVKGRTEVRRGTQEIYNFKASILNDRQTGLQIKKATNDHLSGEIGVGHKPISIKEANPQFKAVTIGQRFSRGKNGKVRAGAAIKRSVGQITVEVIKGKRKAINTAFAPGRATNSKTGQQSFTTAIFARGMRGKPGFKFGKGRMPIDSITTVSPGTAATNDRSLKRYEGAVNDYAQKRFIHHIERLVKEVEDSVRIL